MHRWAFDVSSWNPTEEQFARLLDLLPPDEQARAKRFHFAVDARRTVIGQLMARAILIVGGYLPSETIWHQIVMQRGENGKPELVSPTAPGIAFNTSHHGSWVVTAASSSCANLGVDVARVDLPKSQTEDEDFYSAFDTCFTKSEWAYIDRGARVQKLEEAVDAMDLGGRSDVGRRGRMARFHRVWTLKEAYVKAVGIGLGLDLRRVEFGVGEDAGPRGITVALDGLVLKHAVMEVADLDAEHPVAICRIAAPDTIEDSLDGQQTSGFTFLVLDWDTLSRHLERCGASL
ncbi:hypothetical protein HKX48_005560 [Thoreauomyces humboldtii]|nr:hypothetical protein HKX48_005560 [Thoreauomyces humboldtii]